MHTSVRTRALQCPNSGICDAPQQITYMGLCHAQQTEIRHNCCNPDPAKCRGPQKKPTLFCPVLSFPLHTYRSCESTVRDNRGPGGRAAARVGVGRGGGRGLVHDGGAQGEAAAGEEEEGVLRPAPRGCEIPWYVIACINVFFLFPEKFKSDPCCLYSVLKRSSQKEERREELAEKWAHEKEQGQSPSPER